VVIRSSSALLLPHHSVAPPTDLARLPLPIFQHSFLPDAATIVTPDAPTAAELQAALAAKVRPQAIPPSTPASIGVSVCIWATMDGRKTL